MTEKIIIEGSENWVGQVPEEYAIKCVRRFSAPENPKEYLAFSFVEPANILAVEAGFVKGYGLVKLKPRMKEIVIAQNDLTSPPAILVRDGEDLELLGYLSKLINTVSDEQPEFEEVYHYSGRTSGMQKCDEDAPEWLKEFAIEQNANVAYFKL